jgi:hypothetical protein
MPLIDESPAEELAYFSIDLRVMEDGFTRSLEKDPVLTKTDSDAVMARHLD